MEGTHTAGASEKEKEMTTQWLLHITMYTCACRVCGWVCSSYVRMAWERCGKRLETQQPALTL